MKWRRPPENCPVCGVEVPRKARSCGECGACHESGWKLEGGVDYGALDLPDWAYEDEEEKIVRPARMGGRRRWVGVPLWAWRWVGGGLIGWWIFWMVGYRMQWW